MAKTDDIVNSSPYFVPVIIGGDVLSYSYIREFNRAYGIERAIIILTKDIRMLTSSKFADCRFVNDLGNDDELLVKMYDIAQELQQESPKPLMLALGCDDRQAVFYSKNKDILEEMGYIVPYNDYGLLERITKKHVFYDICEELDIPIPKTWSFNCGEGALEQLPIEEFSFPLIGKPSDCASFQNANVEGKCKIYEIDTPEQLNLEWGRIVASDYNGDFLIQDFIPGDDEAIKTLTTFSDSDGKLCVVSGGTVCLQDHDPTALGNPVCILGERFDEAIEGARRFLEKTSYQGFGNFDIKYDSRDGKYRFFEINPRCGRNTYYMSLGGVNFTELFVERYMKGERIEYKEAYRPFIYSVVPKYVIKKSVKNKELLSRALSAFKQTDQRNPLFYKKDSISHNFWVLLMYVNQIRKFKRFLWSKQK